MRNETLHHARGCQPEVHVVGSFKIGERVQMRRGLPAIAEKQIFVPDKPLECDGVRAVRSDAIPVASTIWERQADDFGR